MSDLDLSVIIDIATKGAGQSKADLVTLQDAVDELNRTGNITEQQNKRLTTAIGGRSKAMDSATDSTKKGAAAGKEYSESLNSQRYALYEVAGAYTAVAAGIGALGRASVLSFADMESGFTKVERTSGQYGDAFKPLERDILSLSREIPTLTSEIQDLAARGAQMGIAAEDVAKFSEVMAKFVATSPEVDVNSVAEAFGRLSNLTGTDDFEAMASAIAKVGVNSAATDAQIIKTTQEIARATSSTSLAASEVIGLAAAFASLGVAPEAARGVMNQFFVQLDKGAAGANDSMAVAAQIMGVTQQRATELFKLDTGQFFQQFVTGLSGVEDITLALDAMGLQGQRLLPAFKALAADTERNAAGQSVLAKALADANTGFAERTELDKQYAPIADDLNSKFIIMKNAVMELAYTIGLELAPAFKGVVDGLIATVQGITDFVNSPIGGFVSRLVAGLLALLGAYAALRAAIALSTAFTIAMSTAMGGTARVAGGLAGSLKNLGVMMGFVGTQGVNGAKGTTALANGLKNLGKATVVIAIIQALVYALSDIPGTAVNAGKALIWIADMVDAVARKLSGVFGFMNTAMKKMGGTVTGPLRDAANSMIAWGKANKAADDSSSDLTAGLGDLYSGLEDVGDAGYDAGSGLGGSDGLAGGADKATQKVRTLLDYASDLSSVMSRAFEIRFGGGTSADNIAKVFNDLRKAAEESAQRIKDIRAEIRALMADIGVLQSDINTQKYFLSIALEYGDTKRAEAIQANLVKLQDELAKKQEDLEKAQSNLTAEQEKNNKTLQGSTEQAIANRDTIRGLVQAYQEQITALAKSGMGQADLRKKAEQLRKDFIKQATQLGFNREELEKYTAGFDDAIFAIDNIPRDVTIDINANPALTALEELRASLQETSDSMGSLGSGGGGGGFGGGGGGFGDSGFEDVPLDIPEDSVKDSGKEAGGNWLLGFWDGLVGFNDKLGAFILGIPGAIWGELMKAGDTAGKYLFNNFFLPSRDTLRRMGEWVINIPTNLGKFAGEAGDNLWNFFTSTLPKTLENAFTTTRDWVTGIPARIKEFAVTAGNGIWNFVTQTLPNWLESSYANVRNWLSRVPGLLRNFALVAGDSIWNFLTATLPNWLSNKMSELTTWFINLPWNLFNTVWNAGSALWNWFLSGFKAGASGTRLGGLLSKAGFADGGYTGAGGKYEPAGIVHRGEYVIPKQHVNQRTGLPYADALGKLSRGSQASGRSYANGGHVTGSGIGSVDLSARSIQLLAQAIDTQILLDGNVVGEAANRSYARNNRVGAN